MLPWRKACIFFSIIHSLKINQRKTFSRLFPHLTRRNCETGIEFLYASSYLTFKFNFRKWKFAVRLGNDWLVGKFIWNLAWYDLLLPFSCNSNEAFSGFLVSFLLPDCLRKIVHFHRKFHVSFHIMIPWDTSSVEKNFCSIFTVQRKQASNAVKLHHVKNYIFLQIHFPFLRSLAFPDFPLRLNRSQTVAFLHLLPPFLAQLNFITRRLKLCSLNFQLITERILRCAGFCV